MCIICENVNRLSSAMSGILKFKVAATATSCKGRTTIIVPEGAQLVVSAAVAEEGAVWFVPNDEEMAFWGCSWLVPSSAVEVVT